jgi:predicted metal-dependent RNase
VEKKGDANFFKAQDIKNCMKKVIAVNLHQTIKVDDELEIRAYYAGHVGFFSTNYFLAILTAFYLLLSFPSGSWCGYVLRESW